MDLSITSNRKILIAQICNLIVMGDTNSASVLLEDYNEHWRKFVMKQDDESETKGLSSFACLIVAVLVVTGWTYFVRSGMLNTVIQYIRTF